MIDNDIAPQMNVRRMNARADTAGLSDSDANTYGDELPMVVWLRGDEPYCGEFCLDADHAMDQLGIKRSRLTQISGKELRVGRLRQGRYIRPVFRQIDINEYLSWTRPTASHRKSAEVIDVATVELEDSIRILRHTAKNFESSLQRASRSILDDQKRRVDIEFFELKNLTFDLINKLSEQLQRRSNETNDHQKESLEQYKQIAASLQIHQDLLERVDKGQSTLETTLVDTARQLQKSSMKIFIELETFCEGQNLWREQLQGSLVNFTKNINELKASVDEVYAEQKAFGDWVAKTTPCNKYNHFSTRRRRRRLGQRGLY